MNVLCDCCLFTCRDAMQVVILRQPERSPRQALVVAVYGHAPQQRPEGRLAVHGAPGQVLRGQLRRAVTQRIIRQNIPQFHWHRSQC